MIRADVLALVKVAALLQNVECHNLHHGPGDFHESDETCPVRLRIHEANKNADRLVGALREVHETAKNGLKNCPSNITGPTHEALESILEAL